MKTQFTLLLATIASLSSVTAQEIVGEFTNIEKYTDFSVSGLSEEKTLSIFESEFEDEMKSVAKKYLKEGEVLTITFTDIDMAGDIQPWRNRHNADIRYIESIYLPRLKITYVLKNAAGEVVAEGEESLSDLSYQMNSMAHMRTQYLHFFYENDLLKNWARKTFRNR